jgi:tetratricopeptide (TPR) repeat protein
VPACEVVYQQDQPLALLTHTPFVIALTARAPVVLALDDLHWADMASVALLRHVARFAARDRLLLVGAYRDVEVTLQQPLADALGALPRETTYEHLALRGLGSNEVAELLQTVADQQVSDALATAIAAETSGNPFFIREVLLHLVEEGKIARHGGQWMSNLSIEQMGIPHGVRQVIQRRLARLSESANRLLRAAAGFSGGFRFDLVARVAGIKESDALDAIDEALAAQLVRSAKAEIFDFTHALVRHTLYAELSPPRQVRLHRQIAETMEQVSNDRAGEIAQHYHRSAPLPGAERGVAYALLAAGQAEAAYAYDDAVTFLRIALQLLPAQDGRRARLLCRLGSALTWALNFDEALPAMRQAGDLIAAEEGEDAAADYLAEAAMGLWRAGCQPGAWALASQGLRYIRDRRDVTWVLLMVNDILRREAEDPEHPGIIIDTPERRSIAEAAERLSFPRSEDAFLGPRGFLAPKSRTDIQNRFRDLPYWLTNGAGEYRRSLPLWEDMVAGAQREGRINDAVICFAQYARCNNALGFTTDARTAYDQATTLFGRLTGSSSETLTLGLARHEMQKVVDEGWEDLLHDAESFLRQGASENNWLLASVRAMAIRLYTRLGRPEEALLLLTTLPGPLERAPAWAISYTPLACETASALWLLRCTDHVEIIERNLHEKVLVPDFRWPMVDGRLSMAQLCALQGRDDEAIEWFAKARTVLDEEGARPLRAIVDYDEALMYHRRGAVGDPERAQPLLDAALQQFRVLGMPGWIRQAEALQVLPVAAASDTAGKQDGAHDNGSSAALTAPAAPADFMHTPDLALVLHNEGDYWTVTYDGTTGRLKDMNGLHYITHLLRHPSREFHVLDLLQSPLPEFRGENHSQRAELRDQGLPILDGAAKSAYRQRLEELREELAEAEEFNDAGRTEHMRAEMEALTEQLASAVGLGGRDRRASSAAERARSTVTQRIKKALKKIGERHPSLADRLARRIKTGAFCVYEPDPVHPIVWQLDQ